MPTSKYKENCIITKTTSKVFKDFDISSDDPNYGIDILAETIYSPCNGIVVQDCLVDLKPSITIQYSEHVSLRFTHFREIYVSAGMVVTNETPIGVADNYIHFEYLTVEETPWLPRVFISPGLALYKHDPNLVLDGNVVFDNNPYRPQYTAEELRDNYLELNRYITEEIGEFVSHGVYNTFDFDLNEDMRL